jgi:signal transduction histidine kinase
MAKMPAGSRSPIAEIIAEGSFLSSVSKQAPGGDDIDTDPPISTHAKRLIRSIYSCTTNKMEETLASLPSIIYQCAEDLTVTTISANAAELIGIRPENLLGNRTLWDERLAVEDRRGLVASINRLRPGEVVSQTYRIIDDRGLPVWVSHSFRKVSTDSGAVIRGCMIPLPTNYHSKGLDSCVIAEFVHKIGNHFQLINLLIGSLRRGAKATNEIEALQETVDRAVEFTRAFMHYNQEPVGSSWVDLGEILRTVTHTNAPLFVERKVMFKDLVQGALNGAFVNGDPILLELAFRSILQNALDATSGGDRVVMSGKYQATGLPGQSIARITITDTGHGIEREFLEKAAAPFFTSKPERNGLGLSMAVRIVESHGGRLNISSNKSHGTEVEIVLPLRDAIEAL